MYMMLQKLPAGSQVNHHFRNMVFTGRFSKSPCRDQAKYFAIQYQIKHLLKMENISTSHKEELHVHPFNNIFSQIGNMVSNEDKVRKTKVRNSQNIQLNPYRETWKTSPSRPCSYSDYLTNCTQVFFVTFCTYAFCFNFIYAFFL